MFVKKKNVTGDHGDNRKMPEWSSHTDCVWLNEKCSYNHLVTSWWPYFGSLGWSCLVGRSMSPEGMVLGAYSLTLRTVPSLYFVIM